MALPQLTAAQRQLAQLSDDMSCLCQPCLRKAVLKAMASDELNFKPAAIPIESIHLPSADGSANLAQPIADKIARKTMPAGALGRLIPLATQLALIQRNLSPQIKLAHVLIFAADHGLAREGVSAYPQEVTWQMVENFLAGGAAINVFARNANMQVSVVNAGVAHNFGERANLIDASMGYGTASALKGPAMSRQSAISALARGANIAHDTPADLIAFGEMGIANTSAAALLTAAFCGRRIEQCVGRGTGVDDKGFAHKTQTLLKTFSLHSKLSDPIDRLAAMGGFEIAMMAGAMLGAAALRKVLVIDGFITTSALLVAHAINSSVLDYCVFAHQSAEAGHKVALAHLKASPLLQLDLRLGEGTGAALATPIVRAAADFLRDMASFDSAGVSDANVNADANANPNFADKK
jgi:nicotinate-nucleotide--dimethylbenzimidazole phosphoribosyltransferase